MPLRIVVQLALSVLACLVGFILTFGDNAGKELSERLLYAVVGGGVCFALVYFPIEYFFKRN